MFLFSLPPDTRTAGRDTRDSVIGLVECPPQLRQAIDGLQQTESTYALVEVDGVFASDDVSDGAALGLAGGLLGGGHFCRVVSSNSSEICASARDRRATAASATVSLAMYVLTEIGCGLVGEIDAA